MTTYFLHIPKTAGSSVRELMRMRFQDNLCPSHLLDHLLLAEHNHFDAYHGHFGAELDRFLGRPLDVLTVLRDPVARTISHYLHVKRDPTHPYHRYVRKQSLKEFIGDPVMYPLIHNFQSRYLARHGNNPLEWGRRLSETELQHACLALQWESVTIGTADEVLLESAQDTLRRCMLVGTVEQFDLFWDNACRLLGINSIPAIKANIATIHLKRSEPDSETLEQIHKHTEIDRKIYDYAVVLASQ